MAGIGACVRRRLLAFICLAPCAGTPFKPMTREALRTAVDAWCSNETAALAQYGVIGSWDVTEVANMNLLFNDQFTCNPDISPWDVSHVTSMNHMFDNARAFNANIGGWDVSRVSEMYAMFSKALRFDQDLSRWNIAGVNRGSAPMRHMFREAETLSSCNKHKINAAFSQKNGKWPYTTSWSTFQCS